jgi:Rieske Fe-S protein
MTQPLPIHDEDAPSACASGELSRRNFLGCSAAVLLATIAAQACGGNITDPSQPVVPPPDGSITYAGGVIAMKLSLLPDLATANGHQVVALTDGARRADVIVINIGNAYRAFSSVCKHEGCTVNSFVKQRMMCPCHGSEFDVNGLPVAGPAPSALREYPLTFTATAGTLSIHV